MVSARRNRGREAIVPCNVAPSCAKIALWAATFFYRKLLMGVVEGREGGESMCLRVLLQDELLNNFCACGLVLVGREQGTVGLLPLV